MSEEKDTRQIDWEGLTKEDHLSSLELRLQASVDINQQKHCMTLKEFVK